MTETIVFPDIEAFAVAYLDDGRLNARMEAPVVVDTRTPNPRPPLAVQVTRVGGARRNLVVDCPLVWVQCWSDDDEKAADLAKWARAELGALDDTDPNWLGIAYRSETGGVAYLEDPLSNSPRYAFTVELTVRGHAA